MLDLMFNHNDLLDKKFKAVADDTRRKIITLLSEHPLNVGEIANRFTISSASISYHLQKLEQSDLITSRRLGRYKQYRLNRDAFEEIYLWLITLNSS